MTRSPRRTETPRPRPAAEARRAPARRRPRRNATDAAIAKRIAGGEDPEAFLCVDCFCWSLEPAFCGCWVRAVF